MQRIALVTYEGKPDLSVSDAGIVPLLRQQGIEVSVVPWTSAIDWHEFSLVLIRSAWDYHTRYQEFLRWIQILESQNVSVWNTPSTLRWNTDKTYLDRIVTDDIRLRPERSEVERLLGSNDKIKRLTQWRPLYTLSSGLAETIMWFGDRNNLKGYKTGIYNI